MESDERRPNLFLSGSAAAPRTKPVSFFPTFTAPKGHWHKEQNISNADGRGNVCSYTRK